MFEVGKKYSNCHDMNYHYDCLYVGISETFLRSVSNGKEFLVANSTYNRYVEFKELRKFVQYVNVDEVGSPMIYDTRIEADLFKYADRIACIRVELTEGQFDD